MTGIKMEKECYEVDTACEWLVCCSRGGLCKLYPPGRPPSFFGKPVMRPRSMVGVAPAPCGRHGVQYRTKTNTKSPFTHNHSTPTLTKYTNSPVQPLNPPHPHLSNHQHPPAPSTPPGPTITPYTRDLIIQPTRTDSLHLFQPHKHPYITQPHSLPPHHHSTTHTRTLSHTKQTKYLQNNTHTKKKLSSMQMA